MRRLPFRKRLFEDDARHRMIEMTAWITEAAGKILHVSCLARSLALWQALRSHGLETTVRLGVRKTGGRFEAHAWAEFEGAVINDRPDIANYFEPISR